jgi:transcriptional regulator with XRE-family HTH domain
VWQRLRQARINAGLSIEELSAKTKIRVAILEALDRGDLAERLGDFYTRTTLRAVARELGLDAETLVAEYVREYEPEPAPPPELRRDPLVPRPASIPPFWRLAFVATAAIVLVSFLTSRSTPTATGEGGAVGTSGAIAAPVEAAEAPAPPAPPKQDGLTFDLRTKGEVWVSAMADGQRVLYGLLQPSERHVLEARQELTLVIGDAAAVDYSINGQPGRVLGGPAEARKILLTPNNYAQFIRTQN